VIGKRALAHAPVVSLMLPVHNGQATISEAVTPVSDAKLPRSGRKPKPMAFKRDELRSRLTEIKRFSRT